MTYNMEDKITFEQMKGIVRKYIEQETFKGADRRIKQMFGEIESEPQ